MTRELVVISGKGGTGKTSLTAAMADLAQPVALADCDVDTPDLHLVAAPRVIRQQPFFGGKKARIEPSLCCGTGRCTSFCRFHAINLQADEGKAVGTVDPIACEGCGSCVAACPSKAIRLEPVNNGQWYESETRFGPMVHARLKPGEDNSGKLVSVVRREARCLAEDRGLPLLIVDGSPGIGCPVIASLTNAHLALVVAEPTPSGVHDAIRVMSLARDLGVETAMCVNRWDLSPAHASRLEDKAARLGAQPVGRVREDFAIVQAQMQGKSVTEFPDSAVAGDIRSVWSKLQEIHSAKYRYKHPSLQGENL